MITVLFIVSVGLTFLVEPPYVLPYVGEVDSRVAWILIAALNVGAGIRGYSKGNFDSIKRYETTWNAYFAEQDKRAQRVEELWDKPITTMFWYLTWIMAAWGIWKTWPE